LSKKADNNQLVDNITDYVKKNKTNIRSIFNRPLGYKDFEKDLVSKFNVPAELAQLISPSVNQRVQEAISDAFLKRELTTILTSDPAKKSLKPTS